MGILLAVSLLVYFERKDAVERYRLLRKRKDAGDITFSR